MDWGLWVFLWVREMNAGKWVESVKVIRKVISSDPVTFRVHSFKSSIASVHLYTLLIRADRPFERQRNLPFLTQPSAAGEVELTPRARWKVYVQPSGRNAACRKEGRKAKTTAS